MTTEKPFTIELSKLRSRAKVDSKQMEVRVEQVAEEHGFVERGATRRRGRPPSPRTGQVHARVFPSIAEEISDEARRRGVQQGVLIEEAWEMYKNAQ